MVMIVGAACCHLWVVEFVKDCHVSMYTSLVARQKGKRRAYNSPAYAHVAGGIVGTHMVEPC